MTYHVMSRGNARQNIFLDDVDRRQFLDRFEAATRRLAVRCPGYCLMDNHVHLILQPQDHPISPLMQQLSSSYCQWFNRRHNRVGHVLQGRFKSVMVESPVTFLRLVRYVLRNPIAARYVEDLANWPWSSYRATVGLEAAPQFLDVERVWRALGVDDASDARQQLPVFLADASDDQIWHDCLALGSEAFLKNLGPALRPHRANEDFVYEARFADRPSLEAVLSSAAPGAALDRAMHRAFGEFAYTLKEIAQYVSRPTSTVWTQIHRVSSSAEVVNARGRGGSTSGTPAPAAARGQISLFRPDSPQSPSSGEKDARKSEN